jgi:Ala-tRNA(Pro) deacylase
MLTPTSENWVKNFLQDHFIKFEYLRHPPKFSSQQLAAAENMTGHRVAKVIVAMANSRPCLLVLPASYLVDIELARKSTGHRDLRFASEHEIADFFPECQIGTVPPLQKWDGVKVYMDPAMRHPGSFIFQAASHSEAIRMSFADWYEIVNPIELDFAKIEDLPAKKSH